MNNCRLRQILDEFRGKYPECQALKMCDQWHKLCGHPVHIKINMNPEKKGKVDICPVCSDPEFTRHCQEHCVDPNCEYLKGTGNE